jgi:hypothetical protein
MTFGSDVQKWFTSILTAQPDSISTGCWRTKGGKNKCSGHTFSKTFYLSLPVLLIIQRDLDEQDGIVPLDKWSYPPELNPLHPSSMESVNKSGVVYKMVGRVFGNRNHFISRFEVPSTLPKDEQGIYDYDDMLYDGYPVKLSHGTLNSCLVGPDRNLRGLRDGYSTRAVIYILEGGYNAQLKILQNQLAKIQQSHHFTISDHTLNVVPEISYTGTSFSRLNDSERTWMSHPYSVHFTDYISTVPRRPASGEAESEEGQTDHEERMAQANTSRPSNETSAPLPHISDPDIALFLADLKRKRQSDNDDSYDPVTSEPQKGKQRHRFLLQKAFIHQNSLEGMGNRGARVDEEAISNLEEAMFTHSDETGRAGNFQWGLNSGNHQGKWAPWVDVPSSWKTREGDDEEECKVVSQSGYLIF